MMDGAPASLDMNTDPARVAIVGAGPGDADLLTVRAVTWLGRADVVVHDRLVGPGVLAYARPGARLIDVGKAPGGHGHSQAAINALLVHHARAGRRVVRLKGGDPFIFGRGGEELEALGRHGIAVEVVPGITAALGCAAAAGIPLTQRGRSQAVTLVTGATADGLADLDWTALAGLGQTLVVYMGVAAAGAIAERLIGAGLDPETPAALRPCWSSARWRARPPTRRRGHRRSTARRREGGGKRGQDGGNRQSVGRRSGGLPDRRRGMVDAAWRRP